MYLSRAVITIPPLHKVKWTVSTSKETEKWTRRHSSVSIQMVMTTLTDRRRATTRTLMDMLTIHTRPKTSRAICPKDLEVVKVLGSSIDLKTMEVGSRIRTQGRLLWATTTVETTTRQTTSSSSTVVGTNNTRIDRTRMQASNNWMIQDIIIVETTPNKTLEVITASTIRKENEWTTCNFKLIEINWHLIN